MTPSQYNTGDGMVFVGEPGESPLTRLPTWELLEELDRRSHASLTSVERQIQSVIAYVEGWLWSKGYENASEFLRREANVDEIVDHMLDDGAPFPFAIDAWKPEGPASP